MSIPEDDPIPTPLCPYHATRDCVERSDPHEYDRTGFRWRCSQGAGRLFRGTEAEFRAERARVLADQAEAMAASPNPEDHQR